MSQARQPQKLGIFLVLAVLGYGLTAYLFQRYSPALNWHAQVDRAAALQKGQTLLDRFQHTAEPRWTGVEAPDYSRESDFYFSQNPNPQYLSVVTPTRVRVMYQLRQNAGTVRITFNSAGRLLSYVFNPNNERREGRGGPGGPPPPGRPPGPRPTSPGNETPQLSPEKQAAQLVQAKQLFNEFLNYDGLFQGEPTVTINREGTQYRWVAKFADDDRINIDGTVIIQGESVIELSLITNLSEAFQKQFTQTTNKNGLTLLPIGLAVLVFIVVACLLLLYISALGRKEILHRPALLFSLGALVVFFFLFGVAGFYDNKVNIGSVGNRPWLYDLLRYLGYGLLAGLFATPLYFIWATGLALVGRSSQRKTIGVELLLKGQWRSRYFNRQLLIGLLCGGALALIPFLLKATLFRSIAFDAIESEDTFIAPNTVLATFLNFEAYGVLLFFGFIVVACERFFRKSYLVIGSLLLCGSIWFAATDYFMGGLPSVLTGGLSTLFLYWLYQRTDLLSVVAASICQTSFLHALSLRVQTAPSLRQSGWLTLGLLALIGLVSWCFSRFGQADSEEIFAPALTDTLSNTSAERERLQAEVVVAARAQQQMLPAQPPVVPGLDIAASCHPSKDVGGDLFDFLTLPNGRIGFVVADVSGKGVPAALYMTLTKGLLASVCETESDPGVILREVNQHLYEVCRKKVFVTLFLAVYDPATKEMTYARAGHNPTVYLAAHTSQASLLRPKGMGLGLSSAKIFNQSLKVASLQLAADDWLVLYSDGITEAMDISKEEYGEERLMKVMEQNATVPTAQQLHEIIANDVKAFLGSVPPQDDQTLVVLRAT